MGKTYYFLLELRILSPNLNGSVEKAAKFHDGTVWVDLTQTMEQLKGATDSSLALMLV